MPLRPFCFLEKRRKRIYQKRLPTFPILERDTNGRYHYHLTVEFPDRFSKEQITLAIWKHWNKIKTGEPISSNAVNTLIDFGWVDYSLKFRSKADYAGSIDWQNVRLKQI